MGCSSDEEDFSFSSSRFRGVERRPPVKLAALLLLPLLAAPAAPLRSPPLKNPALSSPMPGGFLGGWGGDTGLDIAGDHIPVFALAAGTLDYSEWGHTR